MKGAFHEKKRWHDGGGDIGRSYGVCKIKRKEYNRVEEEKEEEEYSVRDKKKRRTIL